VKLSGSEEAITLRSPWSTPDPQWRVSTPAHAMLHTWNPSAGLHIHPRHCPHQGSDSGDSHGPTPGRIPTEAIVTVTLVSFIEESGGRSVHCPRQQHGGGLCSTGAAVRY